MNARRGFPILLDLVLIPPGGALRGAVVEEDNWEKEAKKLVALYEGLLAR